jgi:hypothetical protein
MIPAASETRTPVSRNRANDGRVPPVGEVTTLTGLQQPAQLVIGQHRRRLVGDLGRVHAGHRADGQLALGHRPFEERLEAPVAVQRRERPPALQLVGDEGAHVVAGDRLDLQRVARPARKSANSLTASV